MDRKKAIKLLRSGRSGVRKWNAYRKHHSDVPDLSEIDLSEMDLRGVNLKGVNLYQANFCKAMLCEAKLSGANLGQSDLRWADLALGRLREANLQEADLHGVKLNGANLQNANLRWASIVDANLTKAKFGGSNLTDADFAESTLCMTDLNGADLSRLHLSSTHLLDLDLSLAKGLDEIIHDGPSRIDIATLKASGGDIPDVFLRGCGLAPWEAAFSRLFDASLSDVEIAEIATTKLCAARMHGPMYLGGVFISYSHADTAAVAKIEKRLTSSGASVWRDVHHLGAGKLAKQIDRSMRLQDIILVVLSKDSLKSDWVWNEIEWARRKEKEEGRDVLCPIALDDAWTTHDGDPVLMRQLRQYNILDFSKWKTKQFEIAYQKLESGMKHNYEIRTNVHRSAPESTDQ